MFRTLHAAVAVALVAFVPTVGAAGGSPAQLRLEKERLPQFGPLASKEVGKIQGIGRAVLAARDSYVPDAEQLALRQELLQLKQELEDAGKAAAAPPRLKLAASRSLEVTGPATVSLDPSTNRYQLNLDAQGRATQLAIVSEAPKPLSLPPLLAAATTDSADRFSAVRSRIDKLRQRVRKATGGGQVRTGLSLDSARMRAKILEIDEEISRALDTPSTQTASQLPLFRKRLAAHSLAEERDAQQTDREGDRFAPAPTFQTISRHR